jgi:uncharacterized YkwD family protein
VFYLRNKRTKFLSIALFITMFLLAFTSLSEASVIRYTYRWTPSGWQLVSAEPAPAPSATQYNYYRVQSGDTLYRLSLRFNTTVTELMRINRLSSTTIFVNQLLLVPKTTQPQVPSQPVPQPTPQPTPQPAPQPSPAYVLSQFEQRVLELTNIERQRYGLRALEVDLALSRVARIKSQDLHDNRYFAHNSPIYGSPFDMMKKFGITYRTAGENIAGGQGTPEDVVRGWMNSPGHRANILNASFTHLGVGYFNGPNGYRHYWTQMFVGR